MSDWWNQVGSAEFNDGKGNPFTEGNYLLEVASVRTKKGWEGGSFLIVSFKVIQADNGVQPGAPRDVVFMLDGKNARMSMGDIKSMVYAMFNLDKSNKAEEVRVNELCARAGTASNPFMGVLVAAEARNISIKPSEKNPTGIFCKPRFIHYPGNPKTATQILSMPATAQIPIGPAGYGNPPPGPAPAWGAPPPPPPPVEVYWPTGTSPGRGATHREVNGAWVPL